MTSPWPRLHTFDAEGPHRLNRASSGVRRRGNTCERRAEDVINVVVTKFRTRRTGKDLEIISASHAGSRIIYDYS